MAAGGWAIACEMIKTTFVAAVVVTYRREAELARLLVSLKQSSRVPDFTVVVDNAALVSTRAAVESAEIATYYVACPENAGPGAGWKRGMETALECHPQVSHFLVLDDDVVLPPNAIERLLEASEKAAIICPLLLDDQDAVWAFPEPKEEALRQTIRRVKTLADATLELGRAPLPFLWCTGACILVRRAAVDAVGFHRTDFWMLGEDLEFSMRIAAQGGGVFLPDLGVPHLPPPPASDEQGEAANRRKFRSLLQNLAYLALHHPHSAHLKNYLPGNVRRYFRTFGWNWQALREVSACLTQGILLCRPAGFKKNVPKKEPRVDAAV